MNLLPQNLTQQNRSTMRYRLKNPESEKPEHPSPIQPKLCTCVCQTEFIPRRTNQLYLNAKHRDYHYNHGVRKEKSKSVIGTNKVLNKNLRLLSKHYESKANKNSIYLLNILINQGFNPSQFTGISLYEGEKISYCYNYAYQIILINNQEHIKIYKYENS